MASDHLIHADDVTMTYDETRCFLTRADGTYLDRDEMLEIAKKLQATATLYGSAIAIFNKKLPKKERR